MHKILRDKRLWITLILLVPALIQFFPILYMVSLSFKQGVEVFAFPPTVFPNSLKFDNYEAALKAAPVGRLFNSLVQATAITLLQVFTAILAALPRWRARSLQAKTVSRRSLLP
ncbi:MAG: hypothetical protein R3B54_09750 [Bdellovibrionota bacterium]